MNHAKGLSLAVAMAMTTSGAHGAEVVIDLTLPEIQAAPYYKPYLSVWLEDEAGAHHSTLAVWYDTRLRDNLGKGFLRNLRKWWREAGEAMTLPADGISGPTRGPGAYQLRFDSRSGPLRDLPAGSYTLRVEASREDGGRDMVSLPFDWTGAAASASATGKAEIGHVALDVTP